MRTMYICNLYIQNTQGPGARALSEGRRLGGGGLHHKMAGPRYRRPKRGVYGAWLHRKLSPPDLSSTQQHATGQQLRGMRDLAARARGSCLDASLAVHPTPGAAAERKMWAHCFESHEGLELDRNFSFRRICRRERLATYWQSQIEYIESSALTGQWYMLQAVVLSLQERALTFLVYRCGTTAQITPKHKHPLPRRGRGLSHAAISTAACFR